MVINLKVVFCNKHEFMFRNGSNLIIDAKLWVYIDICRYFHFYN